LQSAVATADRAYNGHLLAANGLGFAHVYVVGLAVLPLGKVNNRVLGIIKHFNLFLI
jgi:hypothetical protein